MKKSSVFNLALLLSGALLMSAAQADELHDYALISPEHLPHLMQNVNKQKAQLKLSSEQETVLQTLARDTQQKMMASFTRARELEKQIARDVVEQGKTPAELASKLDELQRIKRELTDRQIAALNTMRQNLKPEQYQLLLQDADWAKHMAE